MIAEPVKIEVDKIERSRIESVDFNNLKFGQVFTDHMVEMDYENGLWQQPHIRPFGPISLHPAISALHYGQSIFEGLKAYRGDNNQIILFRAYDNAKRMKKSAARMCMPEIPEELFVQTLAALVKLDSEWVPRIPGGSLYIRPFMFATDEYVGIRPSEKYKFIIFCCPVGNYYSEPIKVKVEPFYTRAVEGGTGEAKTAGNYAASLYPARQGQKLGYHQLVWTDGREHKYIEESGTMNIIFQIDDKIITPNLNGSILPGITRDSVLRVARDWGYTVEERRVPVDEIVNAAEQGKLQDAFGAGTAATIAQIHVMNIKDKDYTLPPLDQRKFSNRVLSFMNDLKRGKVNDPYGWTLTL
jgi:branched-chain amino acid aminotransferase